MSLALHLSSTMRVLRSVCLLLTLLSPAAPLKCESCTNLGKNECLYPFPRYCMSMMNACMSSILDTNIFGAHVKIPQMGCRSSRLHHSANYSFTSAFEKYFQANIRVCQTDLCNSAPLQVPPRVFNELQCPACFAQNKDVCDAVETVNCYNDENKCIDFAGTITQFFLGDRKLAFQGCATADFCDFARERRRATSFFTVTATRLRCVDAQSTARKPNTEE